MLIVIAQVTLNEINKLINRTVNNDLALSRIALGGVAHRAGNRVLVVMTIDANYYILSIQKTKLIYSKSFRNKILYSGHQ